jgi:hypothetical protein
VSVRHRDKWVVVDPGTGTYNGPLTVRNGFRCDSAHNGLRVKGLEMFVPHRAFRWLTTASACLSTPILLEHGVLVWGVHDAYADGPDGGRIARAVVTTRGRVVCVDWREPGTAATAELTVACAPQLPVGEVRLLGLDGASVRRGEQKPFQGWHSATYGQWEPAPWLVREVKQPGPVVWGMTTDADLNDPETTGEAVTIGPVTLVTTFEQHRTALRVYTPAGTATRYVPVGDGR